MDIAWAQDYLIRVLQKLFRREKLLIDKLPRDILTNILIRLPAKQVAQMRCVSKPWNAFLSHAYFIKSHLDYSLHNKDEILLVFNEQFHWKPEPCIAHLTKSPDIKLNDLIKLPVDFPDPGKRELGAVIGSVNGLICFSCSFYCRSIHIWNPSLSAVMTLPPYTYPSTDFEVFFGFGFDPKTDDYKVVKLMKSKPLHSDPEYLQVEWLQVEVYSIRKSCWELIPASFPSNVTRICYRNEVCIDGHDGHFHWLCSYVAERIELFMIVAFDLGEETFSEISLPDSITKFKTSRVINFAIFAGRPCVMSDTRRGEFEVWVMNEYGVAESWVKHHMLSQLSGTDVLPIGFTLNNELLFGSFYPLALYNPDTTQVKYLGSNAYPTFFTKVVQYVDSLVWVAPAKRGNNTCIISS